MHQLEKSVIKIDQATQSTWMAAFSVPYMFGACVTHSFFNSDAESFIKIG
jgi:hypothetical protein